MRRSISLGWSPEPRIGSTNSSRSPRALNRIAKLRGYRKLHESAAPISSKRSSHGNAENRQDGQLEILLLKVRRAAVVVQRRIIRFLCYQLAEAGDCHVKVLVFQGLLAFFSRVIVV